VTPVEVADGVVRRPARPWSPAVQALLAHLETAGFDGAPRPLGIDDGYELLGYVEGETAAESPQPDDGVVYEVGRLVRAMHDAQAGFAPPPDARWQLLPGAVPGDDVICHNDVLGHNVVFRGRRPVALIDWELAAPGVRLTDVAAAAAWWAPLRPDDAVRRYGLPTDRRGERLRLLADGYGLEAAERSALLRFTARVLRGWYEAYRVLGGVRRAQPWAERWDRGQGDRILRGVAWLEEHMAELERWLD
jgi:aminoglycoside phosphotransferase (APT) family kinase protein